jgi:lysophospholipid acyltransferase (LPLAT)-like uncharacterized protein
LQKVLCFLIYCFVYLIDKTFRYQYAGLENLESLPKGNPIILAVWHHVLVVGILAQKKDPFTVMVSRSKDADAVAYVCERYGHDVLRGSSRKGKRDKGGAAALTEMVKRISLGSNTALTVDGPTGPARQVKVGIIKLAQKCDVLIIPYAPMFKSYWQFNSWDKFRLPKPFTKALIYYGKPVSVKDLASEEAIALLGAAIDDAEKKANALLLS